MTGLAVVEKARLGALLPISDGGQGQIFRVQSAQQASDGSKVQLVYKQYKSEALQSFDVSALENLALLRDRLPSADRKKLVSRTALPLSLVRDRGRVIGFTMIEVPDQFFHHMNFSMGADRALGEVQHLLQSDVVLAARGLSVTDRLRLEFLLDVCETVQFFHDHGLIVGDFSAKNLLFRLSGNSRCFFLDCDSMITRGRSAVSLVETPAWEVPAGERSGTVASDLYKLGLLAVRLFAGDQITRHPDDAERLDSTLRRLATNALSHSPDGRVAAASWVKPVRKAIAAAAKAHSSNVDVSQSATSGLSAIQTHRAQPIVPPVSAIRPSSVVTPPKSPIPSASGHRASARTKGIIMAAAAAMAVAVLTLGLMALHNNASQTQASGSILSPAAADQASSVNRILSESSHSRSVLQIGVSAVGRCDPKAGSAALHAVVSERTRELRQAKTLDVSAILGGAAMKSNLISAIQYSLRADRDFLNWSRRDNASGCGGKAGKRYYSAGVRQSVEANHAKRRFLGTWNALAGKLRLPRRTQAQI